MTDERLNLPSASAMPRIHNCLGSPQAEAGCAEGPPSDEAQQGSEIAAALEQMNTEGLDANGKSIAERLLDMEKRAVETWCRDIGWDGQKISMHREERLWITRSNGEKVASAKPDAFYISGDVAIVLNHKTGFLPVPSAPVNFQVRCEAVAICKEFPQVKRVRGALARYRFSEDFSATDYSQQDLAYAEQELFLTLWRAAQPGAPRNPGDWCRYCRANGSCQAAATYALLPGVQTMVSAKMGVAITEEYCVSMVQHLSPEQMAFMHRSAPVITKILEAVKQRLKGLSPETLQGIGLRLSEPGSLRQLPDVKTTWELIWRINQMYGEPLLIELDEFQQTCKVGLGKLEELLAERIAAREATTQKAAKLKAAKLLEPIVQREPTQAKLLPL